MDLIGTLAEIPADEHTDNHRNGSHQWDVYCCFFVLIHSLELHINHFDASLEQERDSVVEAVRFVIDHALDPCLDDELGAFDTGRGGDIEGRSLGAVVGFGHFCNGIGLGMKHIRLGLTGVVFADILKARRRTVVPVGNNHAAFDDECADFTALAIRIFGPDSSHLQVAAVKLLLFVAVGFASASIMLVGHTRNAKSDNDERQN